MAGFFGVNLQTNGYTLAVNFEGSVVATDRQLDETRSLARQNGALLGDDLSGEAQDQFWDVVREHTQGTVTCKAVVLVSQVVPYLQAIMHVCMSRELDAAV